MKISELDPSFSERVTERFKDLSKQGKLFYPDELAIFKLFEDKYKPITISEYAKNVGKPYKTVSEWVNKKKLMYIEFGGVIFILK